MGLYVVFWRCADIRAIYWPKLTLFLYILRFLFDFGAKMQFYAVFALGFALLWVPAMIFVHYWVRATKSRALGEKGVHWFFPAFESPCISSLPRIGIPCMGLRAIYVPASVFKFRAKSSYNCILSLFISMQSCIPMQSCIAEITKMALLVFWFLANHLKSFGIMRMMFS